MQLNTLSLNSNTTSTQTNFKLKIYDHKLINLHQDIFIFGKKIQNFQTETSLLKLNLNSFDLKPVLNLNAPSFTHFTLFTFQGFLYFYGKTDKINKIQSKNQLYRFDGFKFTHLQQNGQIDQNTIIFCSCVFNKKFLLIFGYLPSYQNKSESNFIKIQFSSLKQQPSQYKSRWYILDLQQIRIRPVFCHQILPFSEKAQLLWLNGRGYLLLKQSYDSMQKIYLKNRLYEIKFQNFSQLILKLEQISLSEQIIEEQQFLENFFSFDNKNLLFMTGEQLIYLDHSKQIQQNQKKIYCFNLQTFQWKKQPQMISIIGQAGEIVCYENYLVNIGGIFKQQLVQDIQIIQYDHKSKKFNDKKYFKPFNYQQSRCYNCQQAFTYQQNFIYSPLVQKENEFFYIKKKIQMKFLQKLAREVCSQFQAIGMLIDFMKYFKSQQISIRLYEKFSQTKQYWSIGNKIEQQPVFMLFIQGKSSNVISQQLIQESFNNKQGQFCHQELSDFSIQIAKLKLGSLKLGRGFLFVTLTEENKIIVGYSSCSSTEFSETNLKSFSIISYTIRFKKQSSEIYYSSIINRYIIFENLKLYFASPESYEKVEVFKKISERKSVKNLPKYIYVFQVKHLEKRIKSQTFLLKNYEDICIKNRNSQSHLNSLHKYLSHLFLQNQRKIFVQSSLISLKSIYEVFGDYQKNNFIRLISIKDQKNNKVQGQDTHFTTNQDDLPDKKIQFNDKNVEIAEKVTIYSIIQNQKERLEEYYKGLFVYHEKRFVKIISTQKKSFVWRNITKRLNIDFNFQDQFIFEKIVKKLQRWLENLESSIFNGNSHISEN